MGRTLSWHELEKHSLGWTDRFASGYGTKPITGMRLWFGEQEVPGDYVTMNVLQG